jgi:ADP-heptose:LPS heptosyltransferase
MAVSFGRSIGFVAGGIGDQIYHLTQLRALASASFDGKIDIACIHPGPIAILLAHSPWAGKIIDARPLRRYIPFMRGSSTVRQIRQTHYDSAFILHRSTSFKLAAFAASIDRRVGLVGHNIDTLLLTDSLAADAGGDRRALWGHRPFIAAADSWIMAQGLSLDDSTPTILPSPDMRAEIADFMHQLPRPVTIVNLFAADPARRWSLDHANATLNRLASQIGGSLVLNAGPDAGSYHDAMLARWDGPDHVLFDSLRHNPSMARDIALYHAADGYIGVDSFTANLAFNCNLPATVLFAKAGDTLRYKPVVFPLYPDTGKALDSIAPDKILSTAAIMLESASDR